MAMEPGADQRRTRVTWTTWRSTNEENEMSNKLFVGGLSWDTNDEGLRNAFGQHGPVIEAKVVMDRDTGRSRGFGFVTMGDGDATQNAMRGMDGSTLDG